MMKNYTLYTTIDNTPIYRTKDYYFTLCPFHHTGGGRGRTFIYLGITPYSVLQFMFKYRLWAKRFFSKEMLYILDQWLRLSALHHLTPRK